MTKFIPKLKEISTKFGNSESTENKTPLETASESTELEPKPEGALESNGPESVSGNESESAAPETVTGGEESVAIAAPPPPNDSKKPPLAGLKHLSTAIATKLKMPSILKARWLENDKPLYRRRWFWAVTTVGVGTGGGAIALAIALQNLDRSLPDPANALTFARDDTLTIKAADGTILQQRGPATREKLVLQEMPAEVVEAFIASEDKRFYKHKGVDYQGIVRAFVSNLMAREVVEGGSSITQQLARIVFLNQERTLWRKLKEIRLAQKIEEKLSKEQILERYLNLVYLGSGAYGIADAAWVYFSKSLEELTIPEIATIVGLAPAPSEYSPLVDEEAALQRRNLVLQRMQEAGFITPEEAKAAASAPMELEPAPPKRLAAEAPYFTSYIEQELLSYVPEEVLEVGGLTVETTLNLQWQKIAETTVEDVLKRYGKSQRFQQAALVSLDPRNGEVKAMVGGTDFEDTQFNRVTQAQRQPGSTFKGFVYTTAIAAGFSPYRAYLDAPFTVDNYTPKNYSGQHSGWLSLRDALIKSVNVIALRVLLDVGFEPTIEIAQKMGIKSELKPFYSLALGGSEVNLLELTNAYGSLATKGMYAEAHGIKRVLDQHGKVVYEAQFKPERAVDEETTAIVTWMLRGVVTSGTGRAAQLNRPVAGKTGTSDQARDLWFIGYIPQTVTGVWLGNDNNNPTRGSSGTAAQTWHNFMVKAVEGMPVEQFLPLPKKLERRTGSIKAQRVRTGRMYYSKLAESEEAATKKRRLRQPGYLGAERRRYSEADSSQSPRYRKRYRYRAEDTIDEPVSTPRRRRRYYTPEVAPAPQPRVEIRRRKRTYNTEVPVSQPSREVRRRRNSAEVTPAQSTREVRRRRNSAEVTPAQSTREVRRRRNSAEVTPAQSTREVRRRRNSAEVTPVQSTREVRRRRNSAEVTSGQPVRERQTVRRRSPVRRSQSSSPRQAAPGTQSRQAPAATTSPTIELNTHQ